MSTTTQQAIADMDKAEDREAEQRFPLSDVHRAIMEAIGPRRRERRIWIESMSICHDPGTGAGDPLDAEDLEYMAITGAVDEGDRLVIHDNPEWMDPQKRFVLAVQIAIRHGWTLESLTTTEARLWREDK